MTPLGETVPEIPVADVERAQRYYREALGFEIGWLYPGKEIGSVSRGNVYILPEEETAVRGIRSGIGAVPEPGACITLARGRRTTTRPACAPIPFG
jgi:catechol 2,3-dioxygenase-like lactoylglutathione lyase family enzyme